MNPLKRFRLITVQATLAVTAIAAAIGYSLAGRNLAEGLVMGGLVAVIAFWIMARRLEKFAGMTPNAITLSAYRWTGIRLILYAVVLYRAYTLDTERYFGLLGAVIGIFLHKAVLIFVGATGLDLKREMK